jgi:hypothetical protein
MQNDVDNHQEPIPPAFAGTALRGVVQDKRAGTDARIADIHSVESTKDATSRSKNVRAQTPSDTRPKRQTTQLTLWVKPAVKRELERIAEAEGLSLSRTGAAGLEEWLAQRIHIQHAGILQPIIEKAIAAQMRAYSSRIATLLVRSMFTSEQTRALATNILGRQQGVTQPILEQILDGSSNTAKRNITRVTPQLAALIQEVERWLAQQP